MPLPTRVVAAHALPPLMEGIRRTARERGDVALVGECRDWSRVTALVRELRPDVLTIDVALPGMGGPAAIGEMVSVERQRVVVTATNSCGFATDIVACLEGGVVDFACRRPEHSWTSPAFLDALFTRVGIAASMPTESLCPCAIPDLLPAMEAHPGGLWTLLGDIGAVGTLLQLLPRLEPGFPGTLCIALSLPGAVTRALAYYLDARCAYPVHEARPGDPLRPGTAMVLPGDFRASLRPAHDGKPNVYLEPRRPGDPVYALDASLASFTSQVLTHLVVLSGTSPEGVAGAQSVHSSGGQVAIAPRESMLFGGLADRIRPRVAAYTELGSRAICPVMPAGREVVAVALSRP